MKTCKHLVLRNSSALTPWTGARISSLSLVRTRSTSLAGRSLANVAVSEFQALHQPEQKRVSVLLQKTLSLLPRTLSTADGAAGPESSLFWSNILERSITELSSSSDQVPLKATIAGKQFCHRVVHPFIPDPHCLAFVLAPV